MLANNLAKPAILRGTLHVYDVFCRFWNTAVVMFVPKKITQRFMPFHSSKLHPFLIDDSFQMQWACFFITLAQNDRAQTQAEEPLQWLMRGIIQTPALVSTSHVLHLSLLQH